MHERRSPISVLAAISLAVTAGNAGAALDIEDRGPVLSAGGFALRITNAGIIGNAFLDNGLSSDPSFELRPGSGLEALNHAQLWVGAIDANGAPHVSGGPLLEWRPTLDPEDRVRSIERGRPGTTRLFDDDGDGEIDEERLDGLDDDGDGEADEDLGLFSEHMMTATYVDDRPESRYYVYEGGENHEPLGLTVRQDAFAWSAAGHEGIAGLAFTITNHGGFPLENLRVGFLADLDARDRNDRRGHLNDRVVERSFSRTAFEGLSCLTISGFPPGPCQPTACTSELGRTVHVLHDGDPSSTLPWAAVVPLHHTTDPLAFITPASRYARAPSRVSFRSSVYARGRIPGQGGLPATDRERYEAMQGRFAEASSPEFLNDDYVVLVSCGPFARLGPGESIEMHLALVATLDPDSLETVLGNAAEVQHGRTYNLVADTTSFLFPYEWFEGTSGRVGHEVCVEAPAGVTFVWDPHCAAKFNPDLGAQPLEEVYRPGECIWTDADCNTCTGVAGNETRVFWQDPGQSPIAPRVRRVPGDHTMAIEWDNRAEVLVSAGISGPPGGRFVGYRIYKAADWRDRRSLLPDRNRWALIGAFGIDTTLGRLRLDSVRDTTVDYERVLYEQKLYPVGRYRYVDPDVLNGFDYAYVVTAVIEGIIDVGGFARTAMFESPFTPLYEDIVHPRSEARARAGSVWVVPNPYRARASWERPAIVGDPLTRHLDFMGLPRARATIKIWTVSGDHVATIVHDGSSGDGQAPWDLVSRNGQDVESGIYVFTVESALGSQTGRFVVIR